MNQQLYDQFLGAATFIMGVQKFDEAMTEKRELIAVWENEISKAEQKAKRSHRAYGARTGWGVALMIMGFVNAVIYGLVAMIESFWAGVAVFFIFAALGFLGIFLFASARVKRKKLRNAAFKEFEDSKSMAKDAIDFANEDHEQLRIKLLEYVEQNEGLIQFLPSNYRNPQAVGFMLKAIENLRANTITEVINLYELELHHLEQERILNNNAEIMRYNNELMESLNRNQERINSNLQITQALQIFNMLIDD